MPQMRTLESHAANGVFVYAERSRDITKLSTALAVAQGQIDEPKKNRTGQYGDYADLAALRRAARAALALNGLAVIQTYHLSSSDMVLNTTLLHTSGEFISSQVPIKGNANPQQVMAYATYMRRMSYAAILGLSSDDDDDGESAADAAAGSDSKQLEERALRALRTADSDEQIRKVLRTVDQMEQAHSLLEGATARANKVANLRRSELAKAKKSEAAK